MEYSLHFHTSKTMFMEMPPLRMSFMFVNGCV